MQGSKVEKISPAFKRETASVRRTIKPSLWIEIDLKALRSNLKNIRSVIGSVDVLAVVKANAYGHGMVSIAKALENDVRYFGVATLEEALRLREAGVRKSILIFGYVYPHQVHLALENDITMSVSEFAHAAFIHEEAHRLGVKARIHVDVDTGMGRLGIPYRDAKEEILRIANIPTLNIEGIYTHFPIAEETADLFTDEQLKLFAGLISELEKEGLIIPVRHAANSAGLVNYERARLTMVRPGIILYGLYPDPRLKKKIKLRSILSLKARVVLLKELKAGSSVSYGREYIAPRDTVIGVLPIGYGHGYPFSVSGKAQVLFNGKRYPVAGRVSMDYTMVDFGMSSNVHAGDTVTVLGRDGDAEISVSEVAEWAETIPYEIVTRLSAAIPRNYIK
ncbi:MAG: alanine racemase [Candidatus Omnitrophica bacterium]|nr:alanine racemase [Candidatus Omnitrophota bacterium]